ncbi:MAG: cyclomaltodextrinase [Flavobacteriales bacterium]|jgi:cyclomaltodextrinase
MKRIEMIRTDFPRMKSLSAQWLKFGLLVSVISCSPPEPEVSQVQHSDLILGLGSPVTLPVSSPASINLNDYVLDASKLDSVSVETPITIALGEDLMANLNWDKPLPPLVEMQLWSGGIPSTIMLRRSQKQELKLNYSGEAESVHIAGEFTGWSAKGQDFEKVDGAWTKTIFLDPGMYQYQLVIDGTWILDPSNPDSVDNNVGGMNSLLNVGGLEQEGRSILRADSYSEGKIDVLYQSAPLQVYALWENHRLPYEAVQFVGEEISISIPEAAINKDYSTLRVWSYNNQGVSNDLHIPLKNGVPVLNKADVPRQDWHSAQLYFMMVDRFINGDTLNDDPLVDPDVHYKANYQGGDLTGIHQTLDKGYFEDLSMNTVWVSPITQNPLIGYVEFPAPHRKFSGYHGYWPILNTKVDHRLGTEQELRNLIDASHAKDMNIILDFVSNHVHEDHPSVKEHPEWKTQLDLPDGRKNIRIWEDQRLTTWFDTFLPSLDHSIPEVTEMLSDTALFWVKDFGFDGFRHDATKHIPQDFWRTLTRKIKEEVIVEKGQSVFQIGETFGSRELIGSYIGSGMMDGKFDFNLYFDARNVFAMDSEDFDRLGTSLQASLSYYGNHHLMGNITGNHDLPRFISYAGEGLKFGEDEKEAGWNRDIKVENPVGYDKLGQLIAFMWTIPGIPVMYYGDEFGMPGAGDPDNRRLMRFDLSEDESAMLETTKTITGLRADHLALQFGDIYDINAEGKSMSFKRKYFEDEVIVVFNKNSSQQMISVSDETGEWKNHFGSKMHFEDGNLEIHVPAYGFEILTKN